MELTGRWRAAEADDARRRTFPDPDVDDAADGAWTDVEVPGHWRSTAAFATNDGPIVYRKRFEHGAGDSTAGRRYWLELDGVFYQADVWLDGSYVGDTEGYFVPHVFDVTDAIAGRDEHLLAVEVACAPQRDPSAKRNLTGAFQPESGEGAGWNPGGIWRPVRVRETGPLAIVAMRVLCLEATHDRAVLAVRAVIDVPERTDARVRTTVGDVDHVEEQTLAAGRNAVEWKVPVDQPLLWWPHALGAADLVDVTVTVESGGETHDRRSVTTGIRQVRMKDWVMSVNGERLFLKGASQGPARLDIAAASPDELHRQVAVARDAGLDLVRLRAHVSRPEVYDAADRLGVLVWQDLPLSGGYQRGVRKQGTRQAAAAVDVLGHHPSIAIWCGHDEPFPLRPRRGDGPPEPATLVRQGRGFAVPTYTKAVLDGSLHRALAKADRSRPVAAHSGVAGRTDSHVSFGWYDGDTRDLDAFAALWPRAVRFVSSFGAPAPSSPGEVDPELLAAHGLAPDRYASLDSWRDAVHAHQADVAKHHVETLRRLKYRPTGGFAYAALTDPTTDASPALVDRGGTPKPAFEVFAAACAPVIVVAEWPAATYAPGDAIALDVHAVSDLRTPIEGAVIHATLRWSGGEHEWWWTGDVPADAVVRVGTIQAVAPDAPGPLVIDLDLDANRSVVKATNRYTSQVERT